MARRGLYANIAAKKRRIKAGSGEKMRKAGSKGAPSKANFRRAAQTARKKQHGKEGTTQAQEEVEGRSSQEQSIVRSCEGRGQA